MSSAYLWKHASMVQTHLAAPIAETAYVQRGTGQLEAACYVCGEVVVRVHHE